jgi:CheY-like chemotaxis protein
MRKGLEEDIMAEILQGVAAILWPIIAVVFIVVLLVFFKPAIAAIIESAKSRKFTLKVGGQEITMEQASEQQHNLLKDVQNQVLELKNRIETHTQPQSKLEIPSSPQPERQNFSILWVDDNPSNNSYAVQQLSDTGITVDLALSTSDGINRFKQGQYTHIISDMGRREKKFMNYTAGLDLLKEIRSVNPSLPFIIFTTSENVRIYMAQATELGANLITSSWTEIVGYLLKKLIV